MVETRLAAKGAGAGLAATIPPGHARGRSARQRHRGGGGFRDSGIARRSPDRWHSAQGQRRPGHVTKTLLQNIEVLSAGQNIQKDAEGKPVSVPVVNLLVTPEQAEILSLASNETRIQLVLRNPMDKDETNTAGTAVSYLFENRMDWRRRVAKPSAEVPAKGAHPSAAAGASSSASGSRESETRAAAPPITVEVIHGSSRAESKFAQEKINMPRRANRNEFPRIHTLACRERAGLTAALAQAPTTQATASRDLTVTVGKSVLVDSPRSSSASPLPMALWRKRWRSRRARS